MATTLSGLLPFVVHDPGQCDAAFAGEHLVSCGRDGDAGRLAVFAPSSERAVGKAPIATAALAKPAAALATYLPADGLWRAAVVVGNELRVFRVPELSFERTLHRATLPLHHVAASADGAIL